MQVPVNTPFSVTLADPAFEVVNLGVRIEVPLTREIVSYWRPGTLEDGVWTVETESPVALGDYLLVWRTGDPEPPEYEVFFPLSVVPVGANASWGVPEVDRGAVMPTVEDVANLERTRAVATGGSQVSEFSDDTLPTYNDVEELIVIAAPLVLAELPNRIPEHRWESVKQAISLYTAFLIEGSFFREDEGEGNQSLWRTLYNTTILNLQRQIEVDIKRLESWNGLEAWRPEPTVLR